MIGKEPLPTEYLQECEIEPSREAVPESGGGQETVLENGFGGGRETVLEAVPGTEREQGRTPTGEAPGLAQLMTPEALPVARALLEGGTVTLEELLRAVLQLRSAPPAAKKAVPAEQPPQAPLTAQQGEPCLRRLAENSLLPSVIQPDLARGGCYTIGRFDVSFGHKRCDFEFDKKTKAISRLHCKILREADGSYWISDCGSKFGTLVNGSRLQPDVPYPLKPGAEVSFGTGGADYLWENSQEVLP